MNTRITLPPILRPILLGLAVGVVVSTLLLLLCALLTVKMDLPRGAMAPMALVATAVGALAGGLAAGLCARQRGLVWGAVCGTALYLILLVAGLARLGGVAPGYALLKWVTLTVCSAAGGVWGVNRR